MTDEDYMRQALQLAQKGRGWTNPNPMVGAVIVKDGCVIGEGWHTKCGALHAEREAFAHCSEDPQGATIYVTLEPCCHWGKTPPCTEAIIENKIARVVIGAPDPNPLVAGKGVAQLRAAGIEVTEGVLLDECVQINKVFFHYIQTKRPYVVVKYAMTLDGKITTQLGVSQWITGGEARIHTHEQRHRFASILVGIETVLTDDPQLTCRLEGVECNNPVRVVLDSRLRTPLDSALAQTAHDVPTLICASSYDEDHAAALEALGCEIIRVNTSDGRLDLSNVLDQLAARGIDSVYVEGGPTVHASFVEAGLVDEVHAYVAPLMFGGTQAPGPVGGLGVATVQDALHGSITHIEQLGADLFIECEVS